MTRAPSRGRGMPTAIDETAAAAYLDLVRHGMRLGDAAQHLGIGRSSFTRRTRADRQFAAALDEAREAGAKVREEELPHDEYRYNILKCRCPKCRRAAAEGRANRRAAAEPPGDGQGLSQGEARRPTPTPITRPLSKDLDHGQEDRQCPVRGVRVRTQVPPRPLPGVQQEDLLRRREVGSPRRPHGPQPLQAV